jgi:calmodulin
MADLLSVARIAELRVTFTRFDRDGDGLVTEMELAEAMRELGQPSDPAGVRRMLQAADLDANDALDFPEFLALVARRLQDEGETERDLIEAFQCYDTTGAGYITVAGLRQGMAQLGCPLTAREAEEMLREADLDGDGRLDFNDFRRIMMQDHEMIALLGGAHGGLGAGLAAQGSERHDVLRYPA